MDTENTSVEYDEDENCCGVCLTAYKSPRILPCMHTFCRLCLIKLADKTQRDDDDNDKELVHLLCPLCREDIDLSDGGVDLLPMYFDDDDDDDEEDDNVDTNDDGFAGDEDHRDLCAVCENSVPAEYECFQCQKVLCGSCKKNHDTWLKHDVQDLKLDLTQAQDKCVKHPEVKVGYFCIDCDSTVCKECVTSEHSLHQTQTLKSYLMEIDGELRDYSSTIKKKLETVEMSKVMFSSNTESKVLEKIENVKTLGEDFKTELEKACRLENYNQLRDKTLLKRINFIGKRIKKSKRQRKFNINLISEIKELQARIRTHQFFHLSNNVDDIINNQLGTMDFQMGRLFSLKLKDNKNGELNFFFGNINWTMSGRLIMTKNARLVEVSLCCFTKPEDTLAIEAITVDGTLSVEGGGRSEIISRRFGKTFKSKKDHAIWNCPHYLTDKYDYTVKVLFQNANIKYRAQVY